MTTIAANKHQMAADSKTVCGDTWFYTDKMYRIGDAIVGVAGDSTAIEKFLTWYRSRKKQKPEFKDGESFSALILTPKGLWHTDESLSLDNVHDDYTAIGSGAVAALVALDLGCSLIESVEAAIKRDANSGGRVVIMEVED